MDIQSDPEFLVHVNEMGKLFGDGLTKIAEENPELIKEVRVRGLSETLERINESRGLSKDDSTYYGIIQVNVGGKKILRK